MRGKNWTGKEDAALMEVREKFPGLRPTALAQVCKGLCICPSRTESAIRERIRRLDQAARISEEQAQVPEEENTANVYKDLYEDILDAIFNNSKLYDSGYADEIFIDVPSLRRWLKKNEADRYYDRLNELVGLKYIYNAPETDKEGYNGRVVQNPKRY